MIKKLIRKIIPKTIHIKLYLFKRRKYSGQKFIDFEIRKYLNFRKGFFVEMGAMDGIKYSNTLHLEKYKNWKGLLVEPSKKQFELCKQARPKSEVFNFLCSSFNNAGKDYLFHDMGSMSYSKFQNTDIQYEIHHEGAKKVVDKFNLKEETYYVKTTTITELLDSINSPKIINFFSLDVEGAELEVLDGFDFTKYKIQYLLIESRDFNKTNDYLLSKGYIYIDSIDQMNILYGHHSLIN
jgi:FkbM family methyltransferase